MMKKNALTEFDPISRYNAAAIKLSLYRIIEKEYAENSTPLDEITEKEIQRRYDEVCDKQTKALHRIENKALFRKVRKRVILGIVKWCAVLVLLLNTAIVVAAAMDDMALAQVVSFFYSIHDNYMEMRFVEQEKVIEIPGEWSFDYYPTFIPQGYRITDVICSDTIHCVNYENENGWICFTIKKYNFASQIDMEGAVVTPTRVKNELGMMIQKDDWVEICWVEGGYTFEVMIHHDEKDRMSYLVSKIANNIEVIKK